MKRIMKEFVLSEISLVDNPAQTPARVAILKRHEPALKRIAITTQTGGHAHSILTNMQGGEARLGQTSYVDGHTHDWVMDEAGQLFIADAMGHNHGIAVLTKGLASKNGNSDNTTAEGGPDAGGSQPPTGATKAAASGKDDSMTPEQIAALQKQAEDAKKAAEAATKRAERAESISKLNADERAHFDTLKGENADAFLSSTPEQREQVVKNLRDSNPVVFKSLDGTEYRKSDDSRLVKMARERDEDRKTLARQEAIAKQAALEKRAGEELPNIGGDIATRAALLGAIDTIPAETRGKVSEMLKGADAAVKLLGKNIGTSTEPVTKKAAEQLDDLAKAYAEKNKVELGEAYEAVVKTAEGQRLYTEHRSGR